MTVSTIEPLRAAASNCGLVAGDPARIAEISPTRPDGDTLAVIRAGQKIYVLRITPQAGPCVACLGGFLLSQEAPGYVGPATVAADEAAATIEAAVPPGGWAVLLEAIALLTEPDAENLAVVDLTEGTLIQRSLPVRTRCQACGPHGAPTDDVELACDETLAPGSSHLTGSLPQGLQRAFVGAHTVFKHPLLELDGPVTAAQVGVPLLDGSLEPGVGRTESVASANDVAVLEALERYAGLYHSHPQSQVTATLASLGDAAIDPATLGYLRPEVYERRGDRFQMLQPDEAIQWVSVRSLVDGSRRFLPERALYWAWRASRDRALFADTSSGFALGASIGDAVLNGLLEVIERDSFLLAWHRRLALPRLDLGHGAPRSLQQLIARAELFLRAIFEIYWCTLDTGVPTVIALARSIDEDGPQQVLSAGSGLTLASAVSSSVREAAAIFSAVKVTYPQEAERVDRMVDDLSLVDTMMDHCMLGSRRSSTPWFAFLTDGSGGAAPYDQVAERDIWKPRLVDTVAGITERLASAGLEAFAANVTTDELAWKGLAAARVVVPGTLPITFGYELGRVHSLPRLTEATLPFPAQVAPSEFTSAPPHPFP